jgi:hypothetical protein
VPPQASSGIFGITDGNTTGGLGDLVRELPQDDSQDSSTDVGGGVQAGGDRLGISSASNPFKWILTWIAS